MKYYTFLWNYICIYNYIIQQKPRFSIVYILSSNFTWIVQGLKKLFIKEIECCSTKKRMINIEIYKLVSCCK